jgi:predicted flap endonuclease-1-like 5' DNA nuclease
MDQLDAFQYFLTNLLLHNLVLVVGAVLLGLVLGRLVFGKSKAALDQLREALKGQEERANAAERGLRELRERHPGLPESGDGGGATASPDREAELEELRNEKATLELRVCELEETVSELASCRAGLEAEKADLETGMEELRAGGAGGGAEREVEKLLTAMQALEQRVSEAEDAARRELAEELDALRDENRRLAGELAAQEDPRAAEGGTSKGLMAEKERLEEDLVAARERVKTLEAAAQRVRSAKSLPVRRGSKADVEELENRVKEVIKEREQVEKASAVLRKEMRGLRNKVKTIEQQESRESELESTLKETEERLTRAQAAVAKESRIRGSLEKMVEDLEWKLADAGAERERLRDALEAGDARDEGAGGGASGAADDLRGALGLDEEHQGDKEEDPEVSELSGAAAEEESAEDGTEEVAEEDDLTRIKGMGVVLAKKLREAGVTRFRQIADWSDEDVEAISKELRLLNRPKRDDWRGQARSLCGGE